MNLSFTWINILILFGAIQALMFSIILLFQKGPGSKYLAAFVFVFAYNGFETFNWSASLNHIFFDLSAFIIIFAGGPSLFLYVKTVLMPLTAISRKEILAHYAPFIFQLTIRVLGIGVHLLFYYKLIHDEATFLNLVSFSWVHAEPFSMIFFVAFVIASIRMHRRVTGSWIWNLSFKGKSRAEGIWIKSLLIWSSLIGAMWFFTLLSPLVLPIDSPNYYPIELVLVAFTYWLVLNGYHKIKMIRVQKSEEVVQTILPKEAYDHFANLSDIMERRKLFLDPKLNVAKLSSETGIPGKVISAVLNQHQESNFNDFINGYRIREVCRMLADPNVSERFTISGIALECGFNSQATFQRAFKNKMGVSPREYASQVVKQSA